MGIIILNAYVKDYDVNGVLVVEACKALLEAETLREHTGQLKSLVREYVAPTNAACKFSPGMNLRG